MMEIARKVASSIKLPLLSVSLIMYVAWHYSAFINVIPMYVPPNDPSLSYPRVQNQKFTGTDLEMIVIFGYSGFLLCLRILSAKFPSKFPKFSFLASVWLHLICISSSGLITNIEKSLVGRPRPDMYSYCGFNATYATCKSIGSKDKEFVSWPSSHSCMAMSASVFVAMFIQRYFDGFVYLSTPFSVAFIFFAVFVGGTRITDYKHHPDDVNAGFTVGAITSFVIWSGSKKEIFEKKPYAGPERSESDISAIINRMEE